MTLTKEQLSEMTDLVNDRRDEFGMGVFRHLSPGDVRLAHDVIKKWYVEKEESWAMQRISEVTITHEMAMKLSDQGYQRGYEAAKAEVQQPKLIDAAYDNGYDAGYQEAKRTLMAMGYGDGKTAAPEPSTSGHHAEPDPDPDGDDYTDADRKAIEADLNRPYWDDDPDPDGSIAGAAYAEAVEELAPRGFPKEALDAFDNPNREPPGRDYPPISDAAAATPGPEHVVVTPFVTVDKRSLRSLTADAEADSPSASAVSSQQSRITPLVPRRNPSATLRVNSEFSPGDVTLGNGKRKGRPAGHNTIKDLPAGRLGKVLPPLEDLIAEVRRQAVGTKDMPTQAMLNTAKPANWAVATVHLARLEISWEDLAIAAELEPRRKSQPVSA